MKWVIILGALPGFIGWLVYLQYMYAAMKLKVRRGALEDHPEEGIDREWVSRWTLRAALLGAASLLVEVAVVFTAVVVQQGSLRVSSAQSVVLVLVLTIGASATAALSLGAIAQRHIHNHWSALMRDH